MPSSEPAVGLHIASRAAASLLSLLVLTASSLDKWQVGAHRMSSKQCGFDLVGTAIHATSQRSSLCLADMRQRCQGGSSGM